MKKRKKNLRQNIEVWYELETEERIKETEKEAGDV